MRLTTRLAVAGVLAISLAASPALAAPQRVRVPGDANDLQTAIGLVADGGVIELAAGTYATPPRGFTIANLRKAFTVRAAGAVVLDGVGSHLLLRFENGKRERGKLVTFEGITFRDGSSLEEGLGGAVTLKAAQARFVGCVFEHNRATGRTTGGGAVRVLAGSDATFVNTTFRGNSSLNRGGALEISASTVAFHGGLLADNRTNLPGHKATATGGAIFAVDSTLSLTGVRLEGNQAAWAGGAIYAFGHWTAPESTPRTLIEVRRSTFAGNLLAGTIPAPGPTSGGAIHVEDHTTLEVDAAVFSDNVAEFGGAVDSYRALVAIRGSRFERNRTPLAGSVDAGGALFVHSADFSDPSTDFGAINRRPARLEVADTLFQGSGGPAAHTGGCVYAAGDENRVYGTSGVAAAGSLEENRVRLELRRTVFSGCRVENAADGGGGTGGAIQLVLGDAQVEDVLVIDSRSTTSGGAMAIGRGSSGLVAHSTFANNSSQAGGAVALLGSAVQIADSVFIGNQATDGRGGAIFARPATDPAGPRAVGGVVANSIFTANLGTPLFDNEPPTGPLNTVRYSGNQFHLTSGTTVYKHSLLAPGGLSAPELNNLANKSAGGNTRLTSTPRLGTVLGAPPFLGAGVPGSPATSFLGYAWSGRSASLLGQPLTARAGLMTVATAGEHELTVDGGAIDSARIAASACTSGPALCLGGDRFVAEVRFVAEGRAGSGKATSLTGDTGTFWFFDAANVELVVKVLDGRAINGNFWVFYGALTDVEYTLKITDTATGRVRTYRNPSGKMASAADTTAFPAGNAPAAVAAVEPSLAAHPLGPEAALGAAATCVPGATDLCVGGRFRVTLAWKAQGQQGSGKAVALTADTGYFWFFQPTNVEVIIKILDGRPLNGHFWVFYGALSDVEYQIKVVDTQTGRQKVYSNPAGRMASVGDTSALPD